MSKTFLLQVRKCPIEVAFYRTSIGKKWTLTIIRDLIFGSTKFSDFLKTNPELSSKVLAERLKELEGDGIIEKRTFPTTPVTIEYHLTEKGVELNKVLYELSMFGAKYYPDEVLGEGFTYAEAVKVFGTSFLLDKGTLDFYSTPNVKNVVNP